MDAESIMPYLAVWGAVMSTILAVIKFWETWRDRFKIDTSYYFTSEENKIFIRNITTRPIIIAHWELLYCSGRWLHRKVERIACHDHDAGDIRIDPYGTRRLRFAEMDYFSWGYNDLKGRKLYIRLHIVGRKPLLRLVYPR